MKSFSMLQILTILILTFVLLEDHTQALDDEIQKEVEAIVNKAIKDIDFSERLRDPQFQADLKKLVFDHLESMDLKQAFKETTGYSLEVVIILIVLVMSLPAIIINVLILFCFGCLKNIGSRKKPQPLPSSSN